MAADGRACAWQWLAVLGVTSRPVRDRRGGKFDTLLGLREVAYAGEVKRSNEWHGYSLGNWQLSLANEGNHLYPHCE